jgi:hypothetical protein
MGSYHAPPDSPEILNRAAKAAKALRSKTCGRLFLNDTLLERLAQHLEDVATELRPFIQKGNPMVCQRHVTRQRDLTVADQPHV